MAYDRQLTLIDASSVPPVHIVGCGGIGSWTALFLTLAGVQTLHLYDGDSVAETNLHRTPFSPADLGRLKSEALKSLLLSYRPSHEITFHYAWSSALGRFRPPAIVVGALDGLEIRKTLHSAALSDGCVYYDVGAEATGYNVSATPAGWQIAPEPEEGSYYTPIFISPVAMCAAHVSWGILRRLPLEVRFDEVVLNPKGAKE